MQIPIYFEDLLDGSPSRTRKFRSHTSDETIHWDHIENSLNLAPEQKNHALVWIKRCLGYIPENYIYLPHISYIQSLLQNMENGVITQSSFADDILKHMKHIRNDDMKKGGWVGSRVYNYDMRKVYKLLLPGFKQAARERLSLLLGYDPELKYSLGAELHLRLLFEKEFYRPDLPYCEYDFKAATIVNYRKSYYTFDEPTADESDLFAMDYNPFFAEAQQFVLSP